MVTTGRIWPFIYLRRSILQFLSPEQMVKELEEVSFQDVRAERLTCGTVVIYHAVRP